jgi:CRISP-associated protein Cas1
MKDLASSKLKSILHSKRANIFYLDKCRVMQKSGRVVFLTDATDKRNYWNIPIANTTVLMLGNGTSITQAAVRMLAQAGVLIGFCGGGGTPLFAGSEVEWLSPQNEYRPTEYVQGWMSFWFDKEERLKVAKEFQIKRNEYLRYVWGRDKQFRAVGFNVSGGEIESQLQAFLSRTESASSTTDVLLAEAHLAKNLYKFASEKTNQGKFVRDHETVDGANRFLNHGNYLAYGLAAATLWVLGIPHGFAVLHGKTRRGALVFDVADLVKDAIILPWAFICAEKRTTERVFRVHCLESFTQHKSLEFMFNTVKDLSRRGDRK